MPKKSTERLTSVAIKRGDEVHHRGFKSHYMLRAALNPEHKDHRLTVEGDVDGFMTSAGRFVTRREARDVAIGAGQINESWRTAQRDLLSSDINW